MKTETQFKWIVIAFIVTCLMSWSWFCGCSTRPATQPIKSSTTQAVLPKTITLAWDNPDAEVNPCATFYESGLEVTRDFKTWALVGTYPYQLTYRVSVVYDVGPMFFRAYNAIR